jgi:hypothetical protein
MNPEWLAQLAPAHAPPPPGAWPLAPGWWGLALIVLALTAGTLWWWREPRRRHSRAALRELRRIRLTESGPEESARAIEHLLRRYAMAVFGRDRVARLTGETWLAFLGAHGGVQLSGEHGRELLSAAFGGRASDRRAEWLAGADGFVRHRPRNTKRSRT